MTTFNIGDRVIFRDEPANRDGGNLIYTYHLGAPATVTGIYGVAEDLLRVRFDGESEDHRVDLFARRFDPAPLEPEESYYLVDGSGLIQNWAYSAEHDNWSCFADDAKPYFYPGGAYQGLDAWEEIVTNNGIDTGGYVPVPEPEPEPEPEAPARPTVTLGVVTPGERALHPTALEYAQWFDSHVLGDLERTRPVIQALAAGETVDALEAQRALQYVLSSVAHRFGQSMVRRDRAKQVRHVLHIVNAIIEAHVDGLPAFESGKARSRAVAEANEALEVANASVRDLLAERDDLKRALEAATEELRAGAETLTNGTNLLDHVAAERDIALADLGQADARNERYAKVIRYARYRLLDKEGSARLLGYQHGLEA